jgi:hypothetical protein
MIARVPIVSTATAATINSKVGLIGTSIIQVPRPLQPNYRSPDEPTVNAGLRSRLADRERRPYPFFGAASVNPCVLIYTESSNSP